MASFQTEIGRDRLKKWEKIFLVQNRYFPTRAWEFQKKKKKKIKHHPGIIPSRNETGQAEKVRKSFPLSEPFLLDPSYRIPKNVEEIFKKWKNIILASFQAEMGRDRLKKRKKKIFVPNRSYPTRTKEFPKILQKH